MSPTSGDPRITDLRRAVQFLRTGNYDLKLNADGVDETARLCAEMLDLAQDMQKRMTRDPLTTLFNRATTIEILDKEIERARRSRNSIAVLLADLDYFSKVVDTFGVSAGDAVLREIAMCISRSVRTQDYVGRFGPDVFLVVLTDVDPARCVVAANRIHAAIKNQPVIIAKHPVPISLSTGMVIASNTDYMTSPQFIALASEALYEAKNSGRNRIECRHAIPPEEEASLIFMDPDGGENDELQVLLPAN